MRQRVLLSLTLLTLTGVVCAAQNKITLTYKAAKGQVTHSKSTATLNIEEGGMKIEIASKQTGKTTFTNVAANGDITRESVNESDETTFNGQKEPDAEEDKSVTTVVFHPDGTIVSSKSTKEEKDPTHLDVRLDIATSPIYPAKPVSVGDKWEYEIKPNAELGSEAGKGEAEILGFEKVNGVDAVKIKYSFKEANHKPILAVSGTVWAEKSSGDIIKSDLTVEGMQIGGAEGPIAAGVLHDERTDGSPLGDAKGQVATGKPGDKIADGKPEAKKEKTIDETVKDYEKLPGYFTLYRKKESGRETLYMEIKESQLGQLMMMETTASTGTGGRVVAGDPINDLVFKFQRGDGDKLLLVKPNLDHRVDPKLPIARAVKRSYPEAYLDSFKIEALQPDRKSILIDLSGFFKSDIAQISEKFSGGGGLFGGGGSYSMDREKTFTGAIKNFPENLVVEMNYHFVGGGRGGGVGAMGGTDQLADPRSIPFKAVYNLFPLPTESGYAPRLADPRVGYFLTEFQEYNDDSREDVMTRYIYRWDIRKKDPKAALSDPIKPITFWMDNAIPTEYRDSVKEGLLMWNKAFEKVGISNAIIVNQMPDNADWDHADMRYNTIRWVESPDSGYAVALFRVSPVTGQILNANITVDANFTRYIKQERREKVNPASYFDEPTLDAANALSKQSSTRCEYGEGMMRQGWLGMEALHAFAPQYGLVDDKEYLHQYLREVVAHEMGHIMGLRHNFIASTYHTPDELKDAQIVTETGVSSSLMEYTPFNVYALKQKNVPFFSSTVGPYDIWAIQYGYKSFNAATTDSEKSDLMRIAAQCNLPGHAYQSDEMVMQGYDPAVVKFDLSSDPLSYFQKSMQIERYLLVNLDKRKPKYGADYSEFTKAFDSLIGQYSQAASLASHYIGGLHVANNHRGDAGEKPVLVPVSGAEQRRALKILNQYIFAEAAFDFPKRYYAMLGDDPYGGFGSLLGGGSPSPVRDQFASIQKAAMNHLLAPATLTRVANNEFRAAVSSDPLTMPELFASLRNSMWGELGEKRRIGPLRRSLQSAHLDALITLMISPAGGTPDDAKMLAWNELRKIKAQLIVAQKLAAPYDAYTAAHIDESLMRVSRALDAKQTLGGGSPARAASLLDMLMGGKAPN